MASREAMYRILDNVDGVCNIDSDPGYLPRQPARAITSRSSQGCREMLDRHNIHGKQAKLINWMWSGWGRGQGSCEATTRRRQRLRSEALKQDAAASRGI